MKRENINIVLLSLIGISLFFVIMGFIGFVDFSGECLSLYKEAMSYGYSKLAFYTKIQLIFACLIALTFILLLIINLTKLKMRNKKIANVILLSIIIIFSVAMAVFLIFLKSKNFSYIYDYSYMLEYIRSVVSYIAPSVIFSVVMFIWMFREKVFKNVLENSQQQVNNDVKNKTEK